MEEPFYKEYVNTFASTSAASVELFSERALRLCQLLKRTQGIVQKPFLDPSLPHYSALSINERHQALREISDEIAIYEEFLAEGGQLEDTVGLLRHFLTRHDLVAPQGLFECIQPADAVEVFSLSHRMLFRSPNSFAFVSFTVEDLFCRNWQMMTRRPQMYYEQVIAMLRRVFSGSSPDLFDPGIAEHPVDEIGTPERLKVLEHIRWVAILRSQGSIRGVVNVHRVRPRPAS